MKTLEAQLSPLAPFKQFINWLPVAKPNGKVDKLPIETVTGMPVDAHDPQYWVTGAEAVAAAERMGNGVGVAFVFTEQDPFFFFDIDDCVSNGVYSPIACELIETFANAAVELSQSGQGLHIFGYGTSSVPSSQRNKKSKAGFDLYTEKRFVALTGNVIFGDMRTASYNAQLDHIVGKYLTGVEGTESLAEWTTTAQEGGHPIEDDDQLIQKMLNSSSAAAAFGAKASPSDLWTANEAVLSRIFPDTQGEKPFDHSAADMALCTHLAFWTAKNCDRIDRLFRKSALMRDKWAQRQDYRAWTVQGACGTCKRVYGKVDKNDLAVMPEHVKTGDTIKSESTIRTGFQFMSPSQQQDLFAGCVYVRDLHAIFTPDGSILDPQRFKATFGGYVFALDGQNEKTSKNAWEVFTESQAVKFPKVHATAFRPEREPGELIYEEDRILVNTYVPITIDKRPGDVSRILNHLQIMLPDQRDRDIILAYMAACVQYPGVKFQWTPLVQGVEGNGKSLYIRCLNYAIGNRYTHLPNASDLAGNGTKFTEWLNRKLFIGVEEIYVSDRREVSDALKPLITNDRIELQGKGKDQVMGDNRANFFMCSNHKDAITKTRNDRRYSVFYTAQQTEDDLIALGWSDSRGDPTNFFPDLYTWCKKEGYAYFAHYLENYEIPDALNPARQCVRAPKTSSNEEALFMSLGTVEQEIMEAIDNGAYGFQGGWISSVQLNNLLEIKKLDKRVPHVKRKEMLWHLGYEYHPELNEGRVNNVIPAENNSKPRLYIKRGHIHGNLKVCAEIVKQYLDAQKGFAAIERDTSAAAIAAFGKPNA